MSGEQLGAELADGTRVRPAVQCRRCKQWLVAPASVEARLGPVCAAHERAAYRRAACEEITLFDLPEVEHATAE